MYHAIVFESKGMVKKEIVYTLIITDVSNNNKCLYT